MENIRSSLGLFVAILATAAAVQAPRPQRSLRRYNEQRDGAISVAIIPVEEKIAAGRMSARHPNATSPVGYTATDTFNYNSELWTVFENLSHPGGAMVFQSESGKSRYFNNYLEARTDKANVNRTVEMYLGLNSSVINLALNDILAERLLEKGEPVEHHVRDAVPIQYGVNWDTFVGNVQANDTMRIGNTSTTRNYYPMIFAGDAYLHNTFLYNSHTFDGLCSGWMPAPRKVFRHGPDAHDWFEVISFGDVDSTNPSIIHVWFRETWVVNGSVVDRKFSRDYPAFAPAFAGPETNQFYGSLMRFTEYWEEKTNDFVPLKLPDQSWSDMTKHVFPLELITRYGGVWPKYGAYDRDYAGSEYDGFQDTFTSSVTANLLWGRFDQAQKVIDNYFAWFVSDTGAIEMRGPEIPQFGMSLSILARYVQYTGDAALLEKYRGKILAWVNILTTRHDESLRSPGPANGSYGLISGWSESDASLPGGWNPEFYTRPYWNNNAFAARGLKDLSKIALFSDFAANWTARADQMIEQTVKTLTGSIQAGLSPPYVPVLPDMKLTVQESLKTEYPSPQKWSHRVYTELLHAAVLPSSLAGATIDSMRAYSMTSLGVVANVDGLNAGSRDILGFISYGYALALLLQDRIDEFVLFLYTHRYHVHNRGQWIAGEVVGTSPYSWDSPVKNSAYLFCMPAAHSFAIVMRAALVLEHPDDEVLMLGRGIPRAWLATGKESSVVGAPTRWGRVDFSIVLDLHAGTITAVVRFAGDGPAKTLVKLRVPEGRRVTNVWVNKKEATMTGEEVVLQSGEKEFNIVGRLGGTVWPFTD